MTCQEGSNCPWTKGFNDLGFWLDMCETLFGIPPDEVRKNIERTNQFYGGKDFPNGSRVVFTNGEVDPWHALSLLVSPRPDIDTIYVEGASHCEWMQEWKGMPQQIRNAKQAIQNKVGQWLEQLTKLKRSARKFLAASSALQLGLEVHVATLALAVGPAAGPRLLAVSAGSTRTARSQPSGSTPLRITARLAQPKQLKRPPPVHVWNHLEKTSFVPPEEAYCTQVATDSPSCSVPPKLLELLQNMWRDSVARGRRYVCILEVCHNCEDHRRTTKHNPEKYKAYTENVARLVAQEFSFMTVEQMHHSRHFGCCKRLARRLGAFEVYLLAPEPGTNNQICTPYLLHSKLTSLTWPNNQQVKHRCLGALPGIVTRILQLPLQDFSVAEGLEVMKEAKALGLDSWEALDGLADRVSSANRALESGQQAAAQKDKKALREAIQECQELQLADEAIEGWMQDLKQSNMALFNIKRQAKRFQRNAAFSAAARRLEGAVQAPLRVEQLKVAIAKAQQAELPEEDIRAALALAARAEAAVQRVAAGFRQRCLLEVAGAIDDIVQLALQDTALSEAQGTLSLLSQKGACAAQQRDLVELQEVLGAWQIEAGEGGTASGPEYQAILQAEMVRANLAKQVEEAERRFQAQRWDALQSAVERLKDAHIQDAQWERWTSALQREKQWTVLRAVSGAAVSLKRQLYKRRLEAVLHADQVSLEQLDEAADAAEAQQVDGSLVAKARAEASTARQRWSDAQDAMAKKLVDRADVMIWKLQKGRVRLEELTRRQGALWDLVDALQDAENSQDWQAMDRAVAGWKEERPGIEHEAFASETSATRLLRRARDRRGELRLKELRQERPGGGDQLVGIHGFALLAAGFSWQLRMRRVARAF
ncbi:unnamed protein product [Effrenium voratum]|nr:unnamed protein product [Effrenium voratum]